MVCIAPTHPVVADPSIEIESIDFKNEKFDYSKNEVHGKRKSKNLIIMTSTVEYNFQIHPPPPPRGRYL